MNRLWLIISTVLLVGSSVAAADQKISSVHADPKSIVLADQPKTVTITAMVSSDSMLRPDSIAVGRYRDDGTLVASLATMRDDGLNGDLKKSDGVFTAQIRIDESTPMVFLWGVSAVYGDRMVTVPGQAILIQTGQTCQQALLVMADTLERETSREIARLFSDGQSAELLNALDDTTRLELASGFRTARLIERTDESCIFTLSSLNRNIAAEGTITLAKNILGDWAVSSW